MITRALLPAGEFAVLADGQNQWACIAGQAAAEISEDDVLGSLLRFAPRRRFTPEPVCDVEIEYDISAPPPDFEKCRHGGSLVWPFASDAGIVATDWDRLETHEIMALESEEAPRVEAVVQHLARHLGSQSRIFEVGVSHGSLMRALNRTLDGVQLAGCDPSRNMLTRATSASTPGWLFEGDHTAVGTLATRCHAVVSRALSAGVMTRKDALVAFDLMSSTLLPHGWLVLTSRHPPLINPPDLLARGFELHCTIRRLPGARWAPFLVGRKLS